MTSFSNAAFSTDAFSTLAFDFSDVPIDPEPTGGGFHYDPFSHQLRRKRETEEAEKREKLKEEEIIRLRLEAQDVLMRKRELENEKEKTRALELLEKQYLELQNELLIQISALEALKRESIRRRNQAIVLLLMAACPFSFNQPLQFERK